METKGATGMKQDRARKWMWSFLAAIVAVQMYFVRELVAAFFLFALVFAVLATVAFGVFLLDCASQLSVSWAAPHVRAAMGMARRGFAVVEEISKRPFRRPRSETAQ